MGDILQIPKKEKTMKEIVEENRAKRIEETKRIENEIEILKLRIGGRTLPEAGTLPDMAGVEEREPNA